MDSFFQIITDNGKNMIKGLQSNFCSDDHEEEEGEEDDEEDDEDDEDEEDEDEDEEKEKEGEERSKRFKARVWNLQDEADTTDSDEEFEMETDEMVKNDVKAMDDLEEQMERTFLLDRLSCFCHTLQCPIRGLDESRFVGATARRKAKAIVSYFRHSYKATAELADLTDGKRLIGK
jgi:hypothetical protein